MDVRILGEPKSQAESEVRARGMERIIPTGLFNNCILFRN